MLKLLDGGRLNGTWKGLEAGHGLMDRRTRENCIVRTMHLEAQIYP